MYQEESIYNLVEKEKIKPQKENTYTSRYPHDLHPTASTFGLKTTSFPNICNLNGDYTLPRAAHRLIGEFTTFGKPNGTNKKDPNNFTKKGHQYIKHPQRKLFYFKLKLAEKLRGNSDFRKPNIPSISDKPIMGLKTEKNFVTSNAVDVILMATKKKPQTTILYKEKKNYGKVPEYLSKIREDIEKEYTSIREMQKRNEEDEAKKKKVLTNDEIETLREGLKKKLAQLKKEYGNITHKTVFDTLITQKKKTQLEKELLIVENDLERLSRGNIIIDMTR